MIVFEIQDMTCGHCRDAITRAVLAVDAAASIEVDPPGHHVRIESHGVDPRRFVDAITAAGYTPLPIAPAVDRGAPPRASGCCCAAAGSSCGT